MAFEVFGIVKGQPIQSLALCSTIEVAEYHKENTFADFAGRVIIQESEKTQDEVTQAIFDVNAPIFHVEATMSTTDWDSMKCDIKQTTAIQLFDAGTLHNVEQLNTVELQPIERKKLKASMLVLETKGQPFHTMFAQMQEEIMVFLTKGSTATRKRLPVVEAFEATAEETTESEVVEHVAEPIIEGTDVFEHVAEPVVEGADVVEPVAEPVVEGADVVEPVAEPVVEGADVVEPVAEPVVEGADVVEPVAEPIIEETEVVEYVAEPIVEGADVVEPVAEPIIEDTDVVEPIDHTSDEAIAELLSDVDLNNLGTTPITTHEPVAEPFVTAPVADVGSFVPTGSAIPDDLLASDDGFDVASIEALLNDI